MTDIPGKFQLTLELSPELNQTLEELSQKIGISKTDVLRRAITLMQSMVAPEEETPVIPQPTLKSLSELDPWTQNFIGVINLEVENPEENYVDYLEEKYS